MPVTFPAHQGLIAPIKLRWPGAIDATALCIGAAAPDLAYPLGDWLNRHSHTGLGVVVWAIPVTLMAAAVTRWRAANGIFAVVPDLGLFALRSYRVLSRRRPSRPSTLFAATLGATSHVFIDGFTHADRWGARWLGLDRVFAAVPLRGEFTFARVLQYLGHSLGTLSFIVLLVVVSRGHLERWYGTDAVRRARSAQIGSRPRQVFWAITLAPPLAAVVAGIVRGDPVLFLPITCLFIAILAAGVVVAPWVAEAD